MPLTLLLGPVDPGGGWQFRRLRGLADEPLWVGGVGGSQDAAAGGPHGVCPAMVDVSGGMQAQRPAV